MLSITGFVICAVIIFFAGSKLSLYGDLIAEKTGLGKAWIGLILMASVTSLPELMVGISSSYFVQSADIAVGDIFGSCTFNLAILAMLDAFIPKRQCLFNVASPRHLLSAALGLILVAIAGLGLFLPSQIVVTPGLGLISIVFFVIYLFAVRLIYFFDVAGRVDDKPQEYYKGKNELTLKQVLLKYALYGGITIVAALFIPYFADEIASLTGLGKTFVGTFFVAASTSLPEIAVSIAAVRMGAVDMAVGNLFGSNIFNILILSIDDAFYTKGVLLKDASDTNLISVFSVIIMCTIAITGFVYKAKTKNFPIALDALLILMVYFVNLVLVYMFSS